MFGEPGIILRWVWEWKWGLRETSYEEDGLRWTLYKYVVHLGPVRICKVRDSEMERLTKIFEFTEKEQGDEKVSTER